MALPVVYDDAEVCIGIPVIIMMTEVNGAGGVWWYQSYHNRSG